MTDFETHPAGTAARIEQLEAQNKELGNFLAAYMAEAFTAGRTVTELTEVITRANAATAAAFEVAARLCEGIEQHEDTENVEVLIARLCKQEIRALATPDQTAALDRLIAEAVGPYVALLKRWQGLGCPNCNGDCSHANPPIYSCIMQETHAAILAASKKGGA